MTAPRFTDKSGAVLALLGLLMTAHLAFLGFNANNKADGTQVFQRAAETYVAILLALMTPLANKG